MASAGGGAGHQQGLAGESQGLLQAHELPDQQPDVAVRIEQFHAGLLDLFRSGIGGQEALLDQFAEAELGGTVGAEQAASGRQGVVLAGFGVLQLIEQHSRNEHRVDVVTTALAEDHRPQLFEPSEGVGAQGLELVEAFGEQLGKTGLGAVDTEAAVELPQLLGAEIDRVRPEALAGGVTDQGEGVHAELPIGEQQRGADLDLGLADERDQAQSDRPQAGRSPQGRTEPPPEARWAMRPDSCGAGKQENDALWLIVTNKTSFALLQGRSRRWTLWRKPCIHKSACRKWRLMDTVRGPVTASQEPCPLCRR